MKHPKRGDIFLANLDPTVGSEIRKTRPVIVVSNDTGNKFSNTVTVVPLTSQGSGPSLRLFEAFIGFADHPKLSADSKARADQVRTIDKKRLYKSLGSLTAQALSEIDKALVIHLGLS